MSSATERDIQTLVERYGNGVLAIPEISCYHNALKASFEVFVQSGRGILPSIWRVDFKPEDDVHAYLVLDGVVYNTLITWPDDQYPDLDFESLKSMGCDETADIYTQVVGEFMTGKTDNIPMFGKFLAALHSSNVLFAETLAKAFFIAIGDQEAVEVLEKAGI